MIIDLHDLTVNEAIRTFIKKYNQIYKSGYKQKIEVIHGYGSSGKGGKIKKSFKQFTDEHQNYFKIEYTSNLGITNVYPLKKLPEISSTLNEPILRFCQDSPKSLSKIEATFFKNYSSQEIKKTVKTLVKTKELQEILKKRETVYISIKKESL